MNRSKKTLHSFTLTKEIFDEKLHYLCSGRNFKVIPFRNNYVSEKQQKLDILPNLVAPRKSKIEKSMYLFGV